VNQGNVTYTVVAEMLRMQLHQQDTSYSKDRRSQGQAHGPAL